MTDTLKALAKINLFLAITGRRENGYHDLESLFVPVEGLYDTLHIEPGPKGGGCAITPALPGTPTEQNLVHKAWKAYAKATGFAPDIRVTLTKRIPTGAGLGGGSSDAAAMLRWLQEKSGSAALDLEALNALAAGLGADVPFFLLSVPAIAEGIGEKLTPVELNLAGLTLVLALPPVHVSSAWAYGAWNARQAQEKAAAGLQDVLTTGCLTHKRRVSLSPVAAWNDFEAVVFPAHETLRMTKERLFVLGAACAVMSGSGAAVAALFRENRLALEAADDLRTNSLPVHVEALRHWGVAKR